MTAATGAEAGSLGALAEAHRQQLRAARRRALVKNLAIIIGGAIVLIALAFLLPQTERKPWPELIDLAIVGGFAGLVAYGELVSRYRDRPGQLIAAPPTPLYLLINIAAGVAALLLVNKFQVVTETKAPRLYALLLAGFGSIAFFRSSFFTVRIGGSDIGIGPSALLQSLLGAADRMIDRDQAQGRATDVAGIMRHVDFNKAWAALPSLCFLLVEYITPEDQKGVSDQIKSLAATPDIRLELKATILGVYLIRQVGSDVLDLAVQALGTEIRKDPPPPAPAPQA